jgi:hypothetical protein
MNLLEVAKKGKQYNPAYTHYITEGSTDATDDKKPNVTCDRCAKTNLTKCKGLDDKDLCLDCADELINLAKPKPKTEILRKMSQRMFRNRSRTRSRSRSKMLQRMFRNRSKTRSRSRSEK